MRLLVLSDSHSDIHALQYAIDTQAKFKLPDAILYLGDGVNDLSYCETYGIPLYTVCGNCDFFLRNTPDKPPAERLVCFENFTFMLTHGHTYGVKHDLTRAATMAARKGADVLLFGHTHIPFEDCFPDGSLKIYDNSPFFNEKPVYLFNPGSIGEYNGSWGIIEIRSGEIMFSFGKVKQ